MATYTAPLIPRFSVTSAAPLALTVYTNSGAQVAKLTGSVKLRDLMGDIGYQVWVSSVSLGFTLTNYPSSLNNGPTAIADPYNKDATLTKKLSEVKKDEEVTLNFESLNDASLYSFATSGGISSATNTGAVASRKASYNIAYNVDNGNTSYALNVIEDTTRLITTFSISIANRP